MEFLLYLTPDSQQILQQIYKAKFAVYENVGFCKKNKDLFGYTNKDKTLVICTKNIKKSGLNVPYYVDETFMHEAVHAAHMCNRYRPFGIPKRNMPLSDSKLNDIKNSIKISGASSQMEHEAYWMEDKTTEVKKVIQKYCF